MRSESPILEVSEAVNRADCLLILAGAGIGVDSGLPDYRGDQGLWREYPALKKAGLSFEEVANPTLFDSQPRLAWDFYGHRRALYRSTTPHRGFSLLKKWGEATKHGYFAYTSNVDGHFQKAGFDPKLLVECHGNIHRLQCSDPCSDRMWEVEEESSPDDDRFTTHYCPDCGSVARPNVMMFNDWDWLPDVTAGQKNRFEQWLNSLIAAEARVALIEIGAGTGLPAIRYQTAVLAHALDSTLIRINLREADCPEGGISVPLGALEALEQIDQALQKN